MTHCWGLRGTSPEPCAVALPMHCYGSVIHMKTLNRLWPPQIEARGVSSIVQRGYYCGLRLFARVFPFFQVVEL